MRAASISETIIARGERGDKRLSCDVGGERY
jgi:hypothetical protein